VSEAPLAPKGSEKRSYSSSVLNGTLQAEGEGRNPHLYGEIGTCIGPLVFLLTCDTRESPVRSTQMLHAEGAGVAAI